MIAHSTISVINSGDNNTIKATEIVSLAKMELGLDTTDMDLKLERWVVMGMGTLDCPSLKHKRVETVDVSCDDGLTVAPIPCGLYNPIMIVPHCGDYSSQYIYADILELKKCGCDTNNSNLVSYLNTFQFQDDNIVLHNVNNWTGFNENNLHQTFDYPKQLDIYFWGANVGEDGFVRIYQQYEAALVAFLCWRYARASGGKYPRDDKESWFNEFKRERATLISSERKAEADLNRDAVRSLFKALIVAPNCYRGNIRW